MYSLSRSIRIYIFVLSAASYRDASRLPESEIQIYTWKNATLREITDLLKEVILQSISAVPAHRQHQHRLLRHVTLTYSLVYPDRSRNGAIVMKTVSID
jgi:histone deacetylase complex subunit SAP18